MIAYIAGWMTIWYWNLKNPEHRMKKILLFFLIQMTIFRLLRAYFY